MLFRVPDFGDHPDHVTIFVSHPVVPIQQVFHRENKKIYGQCYQIRFEEYSLN